MSDIIHVLPDSIANQIAAGEVIQRPASVVKELVENSIDAGADRITVVVKDAGKTSILVSDNGKGMSHTDARMAFERHATSKIRESNDLFGLKTMGFRGEALASIAAVAAVELKTRQADSQIGTFLEVAASTVVKHEAASCIEGTSFLVKNLFFNVPARRKFLKSDNTEMRHIIYEFQRVALANPEISMALYQDQSLVYDLPAGNFKQRIVAIFGKSSKNYANSLISISADTGIVRISGFVGNPQSASRQPSQFFFANGRFMRHPYFSKAIQKAYENMLQPETQPIYFINFELDPADIDVNVHPTKTEIKFESEKDIFLILMSAVREALGKFNLTPSIDFSTDNNVDIPAFSPESSTQMPKVQVDGSYNPFKSSASSGAGRSSYPSYSRGSSVSRWEELYQSQRETPAEAERAPEEMFAEEQAAQAFFLYKGKYILTEVKSGLMIVDIEQAISRITYEKILLQLQQEQCATQSLLFADSLRLSADEATLFSQIKPELEALGFRFSEVEENAYDVVGIPALMTDFQNISGFLSDVMQSIDLPELVDKEIYERITLKMVSEYSRRKAIKSVRSQADMESLVASLFRTSTPNLSPQGKPVVRIIDDGELFA